MINWFCPKSVVRCGNISLCFTNLVRGSLSSGLLSPNGLLAPLNCCNAGSIWYQASFALFLPYAKLLLESASGKSNTSLFSSVAPLGVEANAQLMAGKRKSIPDLLPSKSSMYTVPPDPFPICGA